jgi:K+/H+ antiporter YhaU regulatory subunit KhtT
MVIHIINGPNLNLVGRREPEVYGNRSIDQYLQELAEQFPQHSIDVFQSNIEGEIVDRLQAVGSDSQLEAFGRFLEGETTPPNEEQEGEMQLRCIPVTPDSPFAGKTLPQSGLRDSWHCVLVGVEKTDGELHSPNVAIPFEGGDILWLVGEQADLERLEDSF